MTAWLSALIPCPSVAATYLVNVNKGDLLDRLVLEGFSNNTSVTSTDDQDALGVRVGGQGDVGDHLLVSILSALALRA